MMKKEITNVTPAVTAIAICNYIIKLRDNTARKEDTNSTRWFSLLV